MSVFSSSRFPCPEWGGLILPLSFPQALSTEFRVHWRDGHAPSAQTGLRWSPGPMNSFFKWRKAPWAPGWMWRRALEFPFKGYWTGPGPNVALTNWVPSFTPTLPHLLLAICLSTPFLAKAKDDGWGEIASFSSLIFNQVTTSLSGERSRRCKRSAKEVSEIVE